MELKRDQYLAGLGSRQIFSGSGYWLFFQAAPAPDFFPKRLRLRLLFFFQAAPALRSQKHPAPTGSGSWLLVKFGKIFFSPQASKVKLQKNIWFFFNRLRLQGPKNTRLRLPPWYLGPDLLKWLLNQKLIFFIGFPISKRLFCYVTCTFKPPSLLLFRFKICPLLADF